MRWPLTKRKMKMNEASDTLRVVLHRAFSLGQLYWQQSDSEYTSQHRKADETRAKFDALVTETLAAISADVPVVQPELRAMLVKARAGLSNGLWDYGPGQDEHEQCDALIAEIDAALSSTPAQGDGGTGGVDVPNGEQR
jgi:hypothetical protein